MLKMKGVNVMQSTSNNRLREIREKNGYTQEEFAELLELSLSGYKKIECGIANITVSKLLILKDKLGISADYILFGESAKMNSVWNDVLVMEDSDKWKMIFRLLSYLSTHQESHEKKKIVLDDVDKIIDRMYNR